MPICLLPSTHRTGSAVRPPVERGIEHGVSERDGELAARGAPLAATEPVIATTRQAALLRDIAFYTSYRAGGFSPTEAMTQLPSFGHHEGCWVMSVGARVIG
jgi:hypothetical protein